MVVWRLELCRPPLFLFSAENRTPGAGIDGGAAPRTTTAQQAPTNDATLEGVGFGGGGSPADGRVSVSSRDEGAGSVEAVRALPGVGEVLDETWDTAESPNFAAALQVSPAGVCTVLFLICSFLAAPPPPPARAPSVIFWNGKPANRVWERQGAEGGYYAVEPLWAKRTPSLLERCWLATRLCATCSMGWDRLDNSRSSRNFVIPTRRV